MAPAGLAALSSVDGLRADRLRMEKETARIEAFSDGVFAIAITLLILEIKIPAAGSGELSVQLLRQWPSYFAFVFSFAFIGIMWINHHRLFTHIKRSNNALLFLNLLLLLGVTAVPFPTAVLAQHLGQSDQRAAAMLYNGIYFAIAVFFALGGTSLAGFMAKNPWGLRRKPMYAVGITG